MCTDIFSSFDDQNGVSFFMSFFVWGLALTSLMGGPVYWLGSSPSRSNSSLLASTVSELVERSQAKHLGASGFFYVLFGSLIGLNVMGLIPFVFSTTSHLAINLQISLPIWTAIVLMSMTYNLGDFLAHLQPLGAPAPLNPFLCVIELVSLLVRPVTLAVRLTANLSTGHILMALLGTGFLSSAVLLTAGVFYFMFEMAVCTIQAYIFTLLPTLYADDHS